MTGGLGGTGNIGTDPLFVDPDGDDNTPGTADDDLALSAVFFSFALVFLIRFVLPRHLPNEAKPGQLSLSFLILSSLATVLWPPSLIRQEFD